MNPAANSFNKRLEQYIFKVANHQIESADPNLQAELLDLWQRVNDTASPNDLGDRSLSQQPTEWTTVLQKPVDWRSVNRNWVQQIIRERSLHHDQYVIRLKQAIEKTQLHLLAVERRSLSKRIRTKQLAHYKYILQMFQQQLADAEGLRDLYFTDLNRSEP